MKQVALALCAVLAMVASGCGGNDDPDREDCTLAGDEDGNGLANCDDPACMMTCEAVCGNGRLEAGETCEDGNTVTGDGCDSNCTKTACGNGVQSMNEGCDDGNAADGDGCDSNCAVTGCGNGVKTPSEACDDGNRKSGDGCDNNCTPTGCGNGVSTLGEACDDGNLTSGDGCDSNCTETACGNGIESNDEVCDDGNATDGDGCDSNCTMTACGNGVPTTGEGCDDGNATNGDGCDNNCKATGCGNGIPTTGEACDDGNAADLDGCSRLCAVEPLEKEPNEDGSPSTGGFDINGNDFGTAFADANGAFTRSVTIRGVISPVGDEDVFLFRNTSAVVQTIQLDIWNRTLGRGAPCGATIDSALHVRNAAGTSLLANDDRNGTTDFCSSLMFGLRPGESAYAHVTERGDNNETPGYGLEATYRPAVCGDGTISPGEMCEDGNAAGGDGCSTLCQIEIASEIEPNNTPAAAAASSIQITGDATIQGTTKPIGDIDMYRVTVTMPTVVRFETLTSLYECTLAAVDLRLLDAAGMPIIADTFGSGINSCGAIVVFLDAGTYFIGVEERGSNAVADYLLQVDFQTARGSEAEPSMTAGVNDTVMTADGSLAGGTDLYVFGDHQAVDDVDVYKISVPPGGRIRAEVVEGDRAAETCESLGIDSLLTLFDQNGVQLANDDDDGRGYCSMIDGSGSAPLDAAARNASAGVQTYYLMVRRSTLASAQQGTFVYRLQVTYH